MRPLLLFLLCFFPYTLSAQFTIGGNVYGGGNEGEVEGNTSVTIRNGQIRNVFGGGRMADVGGRAFVNLDGKNSKGSILIANVYGGNDISGTVGANVSLNESGRDQVPDSLTEVLRGSETLADYPEKNDINNSWSAFIRSSKMPNEGMGYQDDVHCILVGSVYGGGNGDYDYRSVDNTPTAGRTTHYIYERGSNTPIAEKETDTGEAGFTSPTLAKTYLEINGGCLSQVYGGGNNATVTNNTVISMNNTSVGLMSLFAPFDPNGSQTYEEYVAALMQQVAFLSEFTGISMFQSDLNSINYTSTRVFGGNNKVAMAIQPSWNLRNGLIRDLYSGGNQGDMTYERGLLLEIPATSKIKVENVYGGCRRADVHPNVNDAALEEIQLPVESGYQFPKGYSARTLVRGGDIRNVFGGNDVSGTVYGGSAVGIYTSIRGDVYGAGNGSYGYTDNFDLKNVPGYGDFYYDVNGLLDNGRAEGASFTSLESAQALFKHRPNAERVSLRLWGPDADHPTIIGGSIYVGGNSATLYNNRNNRTATGELKIGSNVFANNVFLGNNGEEMVQSSLLGMYKSEVTVNGVDYPYSHMDLTDGTDPVFAEYMKGCASFISPAVVFDKRNDDGTGDPDTYQPFTSYFGSFYCGGNIGSMMWPGTATLNFNREVIIFDKLVAGCNNAHVPIHHLNDDDNDPTNDGAALNVEYLGGVLGSEEEQQPGGMLEDPTDPDSKIMNALVLNLNTIRIEPKRWVVKRDAQYNRVDADDNIITINDQPVYLAECDNACTLANINDTCSHGKHAYLEWNTIDRTGPEVAPVTSGSSSISTQADLDRRLSGGNVYGGCYNTGYVNGSVEINIDATIMHQDELFDRVAEDELGEAILYGTDLTDVLTQDRQNLNILERRTGVCLGRQGMDVLGKALNIFGGGFGEDTEIWGSTTINHNAGYVFQIFGGSERGVIGKAYDYATGATNFVTFNNNVYGFNPKYSCTVNLRGTKPGVSKQDSNDEDMARAEFIYGGGFMGPICGNTIIHLGNGRVFNTFAGSCMADILGHTETYVGVQVDKQSVETGEGFPYVRDYVYCGNDLGGSIMGSKDFIGRVRDEDFDGDGTTTNDNTKAIIQATTAHTSNVTTASAYVEYRQGRAEGIFGGCYGTYDYTNPYFGEYFYATGASDIDADHPAGSARTGYTKPRMGNAFVNFRPTDADDLLIGANKYNFVNRIYGAGQGYPGDADRDILQKSSYVLIDIPQRMTNYLNMEVFGAGAWSGVGMDEYIANKTATQIAALSAAEKTTYYAGLDAKSAIIDLTRGQVGAAYGGSYSEGVTRRTVVNVPDGSTIRIGSIFGGAYGTETFMPCDVYESNVEYHSAAATLIYNPERTDDYGNTIGHPLHNGALYGGNNNERRTLYAHVNIDKRVNMSHYQYGMSRGYVYGAGRGGNTWSEYTEVNLNDGAEVYEVYGGGQAGKVLCAEAITAYKSIFLEKFLPHDGSNNPIWPAGTFKEGEIFTADDLANAWKIGPGYEPASGKAYWETTATNLANPLVRLGDVDDRDWSELDQNDWDLIVNKYNTNVIIHEGAYVANYAYGAGLGEEAKVGGHTYIALLGGEVNKDIYAGGTSGSVEDTFGAENYSVSNREGFEATTTAYIEGGTVRNVYGGGWRGAVGYHKGSINTSTTDDILGSSHVVVGKVNGTSHIDGIPSITRNVYGGGEGGSIFGTAHVKINNGYIGFRYKNTAADSETPVYEYVPELDDAAPDDNLLDKGGNVFGGGYVANSYVDFTEVRMYGGTVRGCLFGGGEIGPVGRGSTHADTLAIGRSSNVPRSATDNTAIAAIYKAGRTDVHLYSGHVMRDVFGGGRGYDNWNGQGWMSDEEKLTMDLSSKGYVFGHTQVYIRGGEIGTEDGVDRGFGNVFGGGDRGFVFSAYEGGRGRKSGERYDQADEGFYYEHDGNDFITHNGEKILTEDCKVLVGVQCMAKEPITIEDVFYPKDAPVPPQDIAYIREHYPSEYSNINTYGNVTANAGITIDRTYQAGEYVTTYALNNLKDKSNEPTQWAKVDDAGVIIHNAIFAGGNVSSGDDQVYANAPTVFGNATASIHDVYNRDLISVGTGHTGGLYGDGNLTFVDGYRGLNITNYGTDFYNLLDDIDFATYDALTDREKEYYELKYECVQACTSKDGHSYDVGDQLSLSDLQTLFEGTDGQTHTDIFNNDGSINSAYWIQKGVCSRYAGRIMNSVQRADFCGVFGSRMVLQGAPDRVPETVDYTNYTINRVREVSLNKKVSTAGDTDPNKAQHGNYFGIYSIVNYLGHLTSDVDMTDVRVTGNSDFPSHSADETYLAYKQYCYEHPEKIRGRNRASSHNKVALASGVYLELTTERSSGKGVYEKDWGYITGVIELDLINVQKGVGGGYVYARNVHGVRSTTGYQHTTNTALNNDAVTRRDYRYSDDGEGYKTATDLSLFETSGNFVHDAQTIIDDCYDIGSKYQGADRSPAHYWYVKGEIYMYDQYISAYTGAPAAYKETVNIPLTITAASHGKLKLLNIQPNHYAYYSHSGTVIGDNETIEINGKDYTLNSPINYWEYSLLPAHEQALFVEKTYTTIAACTINGTTYPKGMVMLPAEYTSIKTASEGYTVHNDETNEIVDFDFIFRETNNISHDTGYILTYDVNNPMEWNDWYSPKSGDSVAGKKNTDEYSALSDATKSDYLVGPTYSIKTAGDAGIYGQHEYVVSDIIDNEVYSSYQSMLSQSHTPSSTQAVFNAAYVVTVDELNTEDKDGNMLRLFKGSALAQDNYTSAQWSAMSSSIAPALVATTTIQVSNSEYIFTGALLTQARKDELIAAAQTASNTELETLLTNSIVPAYYCTSGGLYGGSYYSFGENYRALEAWSSMSPEDREHFTFNYDALDVLIDPTYGRAAGEKYQYDSSAATVSAARANQAMYSLERPVDYTATYESETSITVPNAVTVKHSNGTSESTTTIVQGDELKRVEYEKLPNEQYHYAPISVGEAGNLYVVRTSFIEGETPYAVGQVLSPEEYNSLHQNSRSNLDMLTYTASDVGKTYYYCREEYTIGENGEGHSVTDINTSTTYTTGTVPVGVIIAQGDANTDGTYMHLVNKQKDFLIQGVAPVESSTLYVARNSDIYNLSEDKIITVIYQYDYEDSDDSGMHITPVSERHIVNIHLQFKSGVPTVETITAPDLVLPGTNVVIRTPNVTPGAYEVLGGGWEIYRNAEDAENHANGVEYQPTAHPLYWYQNDYHVAYYAKTYLGKTFSNAVPLSVANYHDLKKVMDDKAHHYYVDHTDVKRDPKIYINDYTTSDPATTANGLTILKDFFDLTTHQRTYTITNGVQTADVISSTSTDPLYNHVGVETSQIGGCKNLEFFLRTDLAAPSGESWTPIGVFSDDGDSTNDHCYDGILHGDGHVISGLDASLFSYLCGEVYNLGVTGTFTSAGLADNGTGFVENCWVKSTATAAANTNAVFNNPTNTATRTNHLVNCYYPNTSGLTAQTGTTAMSESAFYNGEVTYDLNEFYLFKRYCDNTTPAITGNDYAYWKDVNGTLTKQTGHYAEVAGPYLVNVKNVYVGSYVESRFADGDFVYAGGSIPSSADKRYWTETTQDIHGNDVVTKGWAPIWPDDYLFFGQALNFGHVASPAHQPLPAPINRNADRLPTAESGVPNNRVYRAPAYYRSLTMGMAHFNPDAVFAQTKIDDATLIAHKNMTAIDFTGTNGDVASGYQKGLQAAVTASTSSSPALPGGLPARFYPPLLDDDGLFSIQNINLTRNLLVYTGATGGTGTGQTPTASQQTANTVSAYLLDWAYSETNPDYRTVDVYDTHSEKVLGHWVYGSGGSYTAPRDHLLVDKNDFNAPVAYTFDSGKRMWYQRTPDTFVDRKMGWEAISIPFSAEIVTTQQKGELTHFYETTVTDSKGVNVGSTGHEYWLRQFTDGGTTTNNVYTANFKYPAAVSNNTKEYTNDFLWDYYYQYSSDERQDKNTDVYQQEYYKPDNNGIVKTYSDYPYSVAGRPYVIGFPGTTYYEFDMSGNFIPENTRDDQIPAKLSKQTVTFASPTGTSIDVSDSEITTASVTVSEANNGAYTFRPSYLNESFDAGTNTFTLKSNYDSDGDTYDDCSSFVKVPATGAATNVSAFRPYFTFAPTGGVKGMVQSIAFNRINSNLGNDDEQSDDEDFALGYLDIRAVGQRIIVTSHMKEPKTVHIVAASGAVVNTFTINPGQTVETKVHNTGIYLVNRTKLSIRK